VKKHRRVPTLHMPLKIEAAFSGYTLKIEHGIDDSTALELYSASLDKFEIEAKEGGSVVIRWSIASNKAITPQLVGALCGLEGGELIATLTPPEPGTTEATGAEIDGTKGHPGAAEGQGSLLDPDAGGEPRDDGLGSFADDMGGDPEPDDDGSGHTDSGADEQAELEAGIAESLAAAGVKPKRQARAKVH
jgi:hypothetical protein